MMDTTEYAPSCQSAHRKPWNKGKLTGRKPPLLPKHVRATWTHLKLLGKKRDLALFNLAIDSKLRGCDLFRLRALDVAPNGYAIDRASIRAHLAALPGSEDRFLFRGKAGETHPSTRQCARLLGHWLALVGLDPLLFGTHLLRRTKATLIYRKTGNLRAVQLLLGQTKIESTVRYLGIEVDNALEIAEKVDV